MPPLRSFFPLSTLMSPSRCSPTVLYSATSQEPFSLQPHRSPSPCWPSGSLCYKAHLFLESYIELSSIPSPCRRPTFTGVANHSHTEESFTAYCLLTLLVSSSPGIFWRVSPHGPGGVLHTCLVFWSAFPFGFLRSFHLSWGCFTLWYFSWFLQCLAYIGPLYRAILEQCVTPGSFRVLCAKILLLCLNLLPVIDLHVLVCTFFSSGINRWAGRGVFMEFWCSLAQGCLFAGNCYHLSVFSSVI